MNYYKCSNGDRVSKSEIDRKTRQAKIFKLDQQINQIGYNVCQDCFKNDCKPLDCAHLISVDEAQKTGRSELAWDINNIMILGRNCHRKYDKNCIISSKI